MRGKKKHPARASALARPQPPTFDVRAPRSVMAGRLVEEEAPASEVSESIYASKASSIYLFTNFSTLEKV